ncbi:MAG: hypothetical protein RR710_03165, partial [Oscillospiraceae bacterium]
YILSVVDVLPHVVLIVLNLLQVFVFLNLLRGIAGFQLNYKFQLCTFLYVKEKYPKEAHS